MDEIYSVPLAELVEEFHLEIAYEATDYASIRLTVEDVSRPGLQVAGYFDHFEPVRLQVMGNVEISYLDKLSEAERLITLPQVARVMRLMEAIRQSAETSTVIAFEA